MLRGQTQTMTYAYQQLFVGIALAIVLIYLLIVVNFQSWLDPFVIVSALPTALGRNRLDVVHHRARRCLFQRLRARSCAWASPPPTAFSSSASRASGWRRAPTPLTAAIDAGFTRFRPVLMTALAMIIGMAPMALSGELNAPLGRAVIGGLVCSTVATLLFVPAVFRLVHERKPSRASEPAPSLPAEATPI